MKGLIIDHETTSIDALREMFPECDVVHYSTCDAAFFRDQMGDYRYVVLSGGPLPVSPPDALVPEKEFLKTTAMPVLGICLGHQLLCVAEGGALASIGRKRKGFEEWSFLGTTGDMWYNHGWSVSRVPECYRVLSEANGIVECVAHRNKPFFGIQGHPEKAEPFRSLIKKYFLETYVKPTCAETDRS